MCCSLLTGCFQKEADVTDPFYPFYPLYEMPWVFRWRLEYDADSYTGTKFNLIKVAKMGFELLCKFAKVEPPPQKMQTSKGWGPSSGFDLVSTNCGMVLHVPEFAPEAAQKLAAFLQRTTTTSELHEMLKKAQLGQSWWGSISQMTVCEKSGMISIWGSIFDDEHASDYVRS